MPGNQEYIEPFLQEAGWLPTDTTLGLLATNELFGALQSKWHRCSDETLPRGKQASFNKRKVWFAEQGDNGAQLFFLGSSSPSAGWLGNRLLWWPHGRPKGSFVGVASSRLGRQLDTEADWFTVFRTACSKINREQSVLLTAKSTTPDRFVRRAAQLFDVSVASIVCPNDSESILKWFNRIRRTNSPSCKPFYQAYLSPEVTLSTVGEETTSCWNNQPIQDRAVVSMAERLLVFHLRKNGQLEKLVQTRLADPNWSPASLYVALGEGLVERKIADPLLSQGAIGWVVLETLQNQTSKLMEDSRSPSVLTVALPAKRDSGWLTHCTRAQANGWPDQLADEYIDDLLLHHGEVGRSALAAIQRIVLMQCIVATTRMIRGEEGVVCFTEVPLHEVPRLRTFRSHLGRWDFEPYGISIRKEWLEEQGCRPVQYGEETLWNCMPEADRSLFQIRSSRSKRNKKVIDWSLEQEWRHVGNVNLNELPEKAVLLFVPTQGEADQLAAITRWPITILHSES